MSISKLFIIRTLGYIFGFLIGGILFGLFVEDDWLILFKDYKYIIAIIGIIIVFTIYDYFKIYKIMK